MKKLVLLIGLLSASAGANEYCMSIHDLARQIMLSRQDGVDIATMYSVITEENGERNKVSVMLINDAYREPHYSTGRNQERASKEFAEKWFLGCLDAVQD